MKKETIEVSTADTHDLVRRIQRFERKYGCDYRTFTEAGDFDERPGEEWMDDLLWGILEDELRRRLSKGRIEAHLPVRLKVEA